MYYEGGDQNDNDLHYDDDHDNDDVNDDDEMKLNLLRQKPELQLAQGVDRRATNRWKGQGGSPQPWINIIIESVPKKTLSESSQHPLCLEIIFSVVSY